MSVLNYEIHQNVANIYSFYEKLKDFCAVQGWTITRWLHNIAWVDTGGGYYDFDTGTEDYLEVKSTGYGFQMLHFRLQLMSTGNIKIGAHKGDETLDHGNADHPAIIGKWNSLVNNQISDIVMPSVWFFGDETFILAVIKMDESYIHSIYFGSLELDDLAETEFQTCSYLYPAGGFPLWTDKLAVCPFDNYYNSYNLLYDGVEAVDCQPSFIFSSGLYTPLRFASHARALTQNLYSTVRPISQQRFYNKDNTDGIYYPVGNHHVYRFNTRGLKIGERLQYGGEEYLAFPDRSVEANYHGYAVRVV